MNNCFLYPLCHSSVGISHFLHTTLKTRSHPQAPLIFQHCKKKGGELGRQNHATDWLHSLTILHVSPAHHVDCYVQFQAHMPVQLVAHPSPNHSQLCVVEVIIMLTRLTSSLVRNWINLWGPAYRIILCDFTCCHVKNHELAISTVYCTISLYAFFNCGGLLVHFRPSGERSNVAVY